MSIQQDRLIELVEFVQQASQLKVETVASLSEHGQFVLHEHQLQSLPGIRVNRDAEDDEIWLQVERLHETKPPEIDHPILQPWLQLTPSPNEEPQLLNRTTDASLIAAGTYCSSTDEPKKGRIAVDKAATVLLSNYENAGQVHALAAIYLDEIWKPWAVQERLRRQTIQFYAQLFTLENKLNGGMVDTDRELVWGVGIGIWNWQAAKVEYPLLGRLVELKLNKETAAMEIRPRDVDPRLETDWYASVDNSGVGPLEKSAKEFFGDSTSMFSPFDRESFEPVLRSAVAHLDGKGLYWPDHTLPEDRALPKAEENLKVTDTWVLFARPRTNNIFLQDLERLKEQLAKVESYEPALAAIVTEPDTANPIVELPLFRGMSASYGEQAGKARP